MKDLYQDSVKRQKDDSDTYRDNIRSGRLQVKLETDLLEAQKACRNLDINAAENARIELAKNILWRGLDRDLDRQHRDGQIRNRMMYEKGPNLLEDSDDDEYNSVVQELETDDDELDKFEALPLQNKIDMVLHYMRETYFYCFWQDLFQSNKLSLGVDVLTLMRMTWWRIARGSAKMTTKSELRDRCISPHKRLRNIGATSLEFKIHTFRWSAR